MKGPALVVMARAPVAGRVKTRLQPELTPDQCAEVSRAFLNDTLDLVASLPQYTSFLSFTPPEDVILFEVIAPRKMVLMPQPDGDLGRRMYRTMRRLENDGYSPVVLIGSDIPTLQPSTLKLALERLDKADLCLGPSRDGGYCLIGARHIHESLFHGIPWSTDTVLEETVSKAKALGLSMVLLEENHDVDTFVDLRQLHNDIQRLRRTPGARIPRYTEAWLRESVVSSHVTRRGPVG